MNDDFNTVEAIATLFGLAAEIQRSKDQPDQASLNHLRAELLRGLGASLGLLLRSPIEARQAGVLDIDEVSIQNFIAQRAEAKKSRNFSQADAIRAELLAKGIILEDGPDGTLWRRA